jgi:glycerol-3-phosphate acyltransferase PlsY
MLLFTKTVHVLALGLWFGTAIFFTFVVALSLLHTYDALAAPPPGERQPWFPVPPDLERAPPSKHFPEPLRKEQGSRVFGAGVGGIFPWYYLIQDVCSFLALLTAMAWLGTGARPVDRVRVVVLVLALAGAGAGWWLDQVVSKLRVERSAKSDAVLFQGQTSQEGLQAADKVREEFGRWHTYSLFGNFATIFLVTVAMALAAQLPIPAPTSAVPPVPQPAPAHPD